MITLEEKLQNKIIELGVLRLFIPHHSFPVSGDLKWYEERILRVKFEICLLQALITKELPDDYCDFVEVHGSACCEDEDEAE